MKSERVLFFLILSLTARLASAANLAELNPSAVRTITPSEVNLDFEEVDDLKDLECLATTPPNSAMICRFRIWNGGPSTLHSIKWFATMQMTFKFGPINTHSPNSPTDRGPYIGREEHLVTGLNVRPSSLYYSPWMGVPFVGGYAGFGVLSYAVTIEETDPPAVSLPDTLNTITGFSINL